MKYNSCPLQRKEYDFKELEKVVVSKKIPEMLIGEMEALRENYGSDLYNLTIMAYALGAVKTAKALKESGSIDDILDAEKTAGKMQNTLCDLREKQIIKEMMSVLEEADYGQYRRKNRGNRCFEME